MKAADAEGTVRAVWLVFEEKNYRLFWSDIELAEPLINASKRATDSAPLSGM